MANCAVAEPLINTLVVSNTRMKIRVVTLSTHCLGRCFEVFRLNSPVMFARYRHRVALTANGRLSLPGTRYHENQIRENESRMNSNVKRLAFASLLAAMVLVSVEVIAHILYFAQNGSTYTPARLVDITHRTSVRDIPSPELEEIAHRRILHPYVGYAIDRRETMGMAGKVHPIQQRGSEKFVVAITGGSVANQVCSVFDDALREALEARTLALHPVVVCLTVDGFKQPQQLLSINFLMSVGAEFDAVVNIDGFNDIVLPVFENHQDKVYPFYPRAWQSFVNRRPSQSTILGAGEIAYLRGEQARRIALARSSFYGRSAVFGLTQTRALRRSADRIATIQGKLLEEVTELPFEAQGPFEEVDDIAQVYDAAADVWARSSILMHNLLESSGTAYVHVLQPNQYVAGSKVLSANERKVAYNLDHPYANFAIRGYPFLADASQSIQRAGVEYFDATAIFRDVTEDVYQDDCCHVNRFGKQWLAREVANRLLDHARLDAP